MVDVSGDGKEKDEAVAVSSESPTVCCFSVRIGSLVCLVVQNCTAVLLMRFTMTRIPKSGKQYNVASVVIVTELVKLIVCLVALIRKPQLAGNEVKSITSIFGELVNREALKMAVPAGCYTLQNNLLFVALANLEATLFQVTYQLKLLVTALFMVVLLGKSLTMFKWLALILLFVGIVLTQIKADLVAKKQGTTEQTINGLTAVVVCSVSSAFASVYFEKVLKAASSSLPVKNIQLSIFSIMFAFPVYSLVDGKSLSEFFTGYDVAVAYLVFNQAAGGLLVALVIKYADNILKGFATSVAIVLSGVFSFLLLDFVPSFAFLGGAALVIVAVYMYAMPDKERV